MWPCLPCVNIPVVFFVIINVYRKWLRYCLLFRWRWLAVIFHLANQLWKCKIYIPNFCLFNVSDFIISRKPLAVINPCIGKRLVRIPIGFLWFCRSQGIAVYRYASRWRLLQFRLFSARSQTKHKRKTAKDWQDSFHHEPPSMQGLPLIFFQNRAELRVVQALIFRGPELFRPNALGPGQGVRHNGFRHVPTVRCFGGKANVGNISATTI